MWPERLLLVRPHSARNVDRRNKKKRNALQLGKLQRRPLVVRLIARKPVPVLRRIVPKKQKKLYKRQKAKKRAQPVLRKRIRVVRLLQKTPRNGGSRRLHQKKEPQKVAMDQLLKLVLPLWLPPHLYRKPLNLHLPKALVRLRIVLVLRVCLVLLPPYRQVF